MYGFTGAGAASLSGYITAESVEEMEGENKSYQVWPLFLHDLHDDHISESISQLCEY